MKFVERFCKFVGAVKVRESNNQTRIVGIDGIVMRKHFKVLFETDAISKTMFTQLTDTSITLNSFFIPDFLYMLSVFKQDPKCGWSARRTIAKIVHGIMNDTWYKITTQPVVSMIDEKKSDQLKWQAMPKQIEFLRLYGERIPQYDLRGYLLAAAPGSGKTFVDLLVATCVIPDSIAEVKIIISPKKAIHLVWEKSINAVFKKIPTHWVSGDGKMPLEKTEYYVFNFEQLDQAVTLGRHLKSKGVRYFVIVDESHNFADYRSNRTQKLVELQTIRDDIYFIWASGSPILKMGSELSSFLKCSDPRYDADADRRFRKIYSSSPGRAAEIFNHRLGQMMAFKVAKSEVSKTKPTVRELPVKLPPNLAHKYLMSSVREEMKIFIEQRLMFYKENIKANQAIVSKWLDYHESQLKTKTDRKLFEEYQKNLSMIMRAPDRMLSKPMAEARAYERSKLFPSLPPMERRAFRGALSAIKNIKLKVRGEALGTILSKRRSECAAMLGIYCKPEIILKESLSKTLFFASSIFPVKMVAKYLEQQGFEPLLVYADTNSQLTQMMERFDTEPNVNPICATMQSLSEAVPVISASTVVFLNRPPRQAHWDQIVARADRLGQIHPVTVIEVTLDTGDEPNVSSTMDDILANVREIINKLVGSDFSGPSVEDRVYNEVVDSSQEDVSVNLNDEKLGL